MEIGHKIGIMSMERNEAIEIVKKNYPHVATSDTQFETALRELVPDLVNEEDKIKTFLSVVVNNLSAPNFVDFTKNEVLAWLEKQKEQKPAEWSEEDSRILYNVIAYVGYAAGQRGVKDDEFKEANSWLKSFPERFNPQPKQEWSEEDENKFQMIGGVLMTTACGEMLVSWLKSRTKYAGYIPHWKPSEEQMDALKHAYSMMNGQAGTDLANLYYDLKKLQ